MSVGWTPNWPASSLTVRSPLSAAKATCAFNVAVCVFRLPATAHPFPGPTCSLTGGPVFGVQYTAMLFVRAVVICETCIRHLLSDLRRKREGGAPREVAEHRARVPLPRPCTLIYPRLRL